VINRPKLLMMILMFPSKRNFNQGGKKKKAKREIDYSDDSFQLLEKKNEQNNFSECLILRR